MTGTSMDGIDISLVQTNGLELRRLNKNYFYKYNLQTRNKLMDLQMFSYQSKPLSKKTTKDGPLFVSLNLLFFIKSFSKAKALLIKESFTFSAFKTNSTLSWLIERLNIKVFFKIIFKRAKFR